MNAIRKQFHGSAQDARDRFSASLAATSRGVMESVDFIGSNPDPANRTADVQNRAIPLQHLQRRARQIAHLISVLGQQLSGVPESTEQTELVGLVADLAAQLHSSIEPMSGLYPDAYSKSGHLAAIVVAMYAATRTGVSAADEAHMSMANQFCWLQDALEGLASELVTYLGAGE